VKGLAIIAACVALVAAACGSEGRDKPVARVAGHPISREQLDEAVEHFQEEARNEGRPFPAKGSGDYKKVERRLLDLLVERKELEIAAARIGVHVSDEEVERRLENAGGDNGEAKREGFLRDTARAALVNEAVFSKVTAGVRVTPSEIRRYYVTHRSQYGNASFAAARASIRSALLAMRKNDVMARWTAGAKRRLSPTVKYQLND
jgi:SurA N-terminal domain